MNASTLTLTRRAMSRFLSEAGADNFHPKTLEDRKLVAEILVFASEIILDRGVYELSEGEQIVEALEILDPEREFITDLIDC